MFPTVSFSPSECRLPATLKAPAPVLVGLYIVWWCKGNQHQINHNECTLPTGVVVGGDKRQPWTIIQWEAQLPLESNVLYFTELQKLFSRTVSNRTEIQSFFPLVQKQNKQMENKPLIGGTLLLQFQVTISFFFFKCLPFFVLFLSFYT